MGVTIHYHGKLNRPDLVHELCDELEDVSRAMEWQFYLINENEKPGEVGLKGIFIIPHKESEPLSLVFDQNGILRNVFMMNFAEEEPELSFINHIKTQFAPSEVHIAVIRLLKYIRNKYISNLYVSDEGEYWETGDEALLKKKISFLNSKLDLLKDALSSLTIEEADSPEDIADKMERLLNDTFLKGKSQKKKKKK